MDKSIKASDLAVRSDGAVMIGDERLSRDVSRLSLSAPMAQKTNAGCVNDQDCTSTNNVSCTNSGTC